MSNEILLIINLIFVYGGVLLWHYMWGAVGMYCWTVLATIAANIEVLLLVHAFGMEQTLGNILFASTFLVTDILSELYGRKEADKAVNIGIAASVFFVIMSQLWLQYTPAPKDFAFPHMQAIFSNTPRIMLTGLIVYGLVQKFDVWLYHKWWELTEKYCGEKSRFLWLRNNGSTMVSQLLNTLLFTVGAFYGTYDWQTLLNIMFFSYIIFICTSILDTPIIYWARYSARRTER
ncbi:MAG: queuosine precursor transporter [Acidaminococcaceae bacterium]|nr:queuosine precursor transporter [Acidaminococcaceae bacterium]